MSAVPPWLIFSPRDPRIARPPEVATKHRRRAKENAPAILAASHDRGLSSAAAFARIAKRRAVSDKSGWHKTDIESLPLNVRFRGNSGHVVLSFYEYGPRPHQGLRPRPEEHRQRVARMRTR